MNLSLVWELLSDSAYVLIEYLHVTNILFHMIFYSKMNYRERMTWAGTPTAFSILLNFFTF